MKSVTTALENYLNNQKQLTACDLYTITLNNGNVYRYTDFDTDVTYGNYTWTHNAFLFKRQQIKLNPQVQVDSISVTIHADQEDTIDGVQLNRAAHTGVLDKSYLKLQRCFFSGTSVVGVVSLFSGKIEIKQCGGLELSLTVKAETSGLNMEFPIRKYYPQGTYEKTGSTISSSTDETTTLITPFVPLREVLM